MAPWLFVSPDSPPHRLVIFKRRQEARDRSNTRRFFAPGFVFPKEESGLDRGVKLLIHALVIATVLIGSDWAMNDGRETARLVYHFRPQVMLNEVRLQQYRSAAFIRQRVDSVAP
jgi:hypothetical protein